MRPESRFEIVVGILVEETVVDKHTYPDKAVVEQVEELGENQTAWKSAVQEIEEDDDSDCHVFKAKKDEEVGESVVKPSSVVQYKSI